jgi:hypothetical protein
MGRCVYFIVAVFSLAPATLGFQAVEKPRLKLTKCRASRRDLLACAITTAASAALLGIKPEPALAIGPVKIDLLNPTYSAVPCPKDRPIPGEKAMKGMKGLCVTVDVALDTSPEKDLDKVGVYGFVSRYIRQQDD